MTPMHVLRLDHCAETMIVESDRDTLQCYTRRVAVFHSPQEMSTGSVCHLIYIGHCPVHRMREPF